MARFSAVMALTLVSAASLIAADDEYVFKSEVSLARVDTQVVDRNNQAITGLRAQDFVLTEDGQVKDIRNFLSEDMPMDLLLLLDVSGSMRPHVERIAHAASTALQVLGDEDRVAIMVFDRGTRVRLPFKKSLESVQNELGHLLNDEGFDGGTDITRALLEASRYIQVNGRKDARRAIVILTDDQTERARDEIGVGNALARANTVLSALIAPDAMAIYQQRYPTSGGGNGPYGRSGGGLGGLGGVIIGGGGPWGRRSPGSNYPGGGYPGGGYPSGGGYPGGGYPGGGYPGGGYPSGGGYPGGGYPGGGYPSGGGYPGGGPVIIAGRTHSAGTSEIARSSGGDSMPVSAASALEDTLNRLRQRYALFYHAGTGASHNVQVHLADGAWRHFGNPEVRFRRVSINSDGSGTPDAVMVSRGPAPAVPLPPQSSASASSDPDDDGWRPDTGQDRTPVMRRRRPAVNEDGSRGPSPDVANSPDPQPAVDDTPRRTPVPATQTDRTQPAPAPAATSTAPAATSTNDGRGGWRRVDEPPPGDDGGAWRKSTPAPANKPASKR
ncbi:MAG TPA: VWA domain-containing protein [Bryobacteraceae bacterium]|nr:VWA domain-containing protein [Bryobacteraceae bacterium]